VFYIPERCINPLEQQLKCKSTTHTENICLLGVKPTDDFMCLGREMHIKFLLENLKKNATWKDGRPYFKWIRMASRDDIHPAGDREQWRFP